jgi:hypothetical protein
LTPQTYPKFNFAHPVGCHTGFPLNTILHKRIEIQLKVVFLIYYKGFSRQAKPYHTTLSATASLFRSNSQGICFWHNPAGS